MSTRQHLEPAGAARLLPSGGVVVGLDDSPTAVRALDWAVDQAVLEHRPLVLTHAVDPHGSRAAALANAERLLAEAAEHAQRRARRGLDVHEHTEDSDPAALLVALSADAATIVLGSHGRGGIRTALLGSVSASVASRAGCPVVVHRPHAHPGVVRRGVAVGVSATDHSHSTLTFAYATASARGWPLTVVHIVTDAESLLLPPRVVTGRDLDALTGERLQVAEALAGFADTYPDVRTQVMIARGDLEERLTSVADRMHLLVVGRGAAQRRLSRPMSIAVLENADCPVAVVPD